MVSKMGNVCEIYRKEDGLEYVDFNPPYTEFSRLLYDKEFIMEKVKKVLDILFDDNSFQKKVLFMQKFREELDCFIK
jgi:hypothetical protein